MFMWHRMPIRSLQDVLQVYRMIMDVHGVQDVHVMFTRVQDPHGVMGIYGAAGDAVRV